MGVSTATIKSGHCLTIETSTLMLTASRRNHVDIHIDILRSILEQFMRELPCQYLSVVDFHSDECTLPYGYSRGVVCKRE